MFSCGLVIALFCGSHADVVVEVIAAATGVGVALVVAVIVVKVVAVIVAFTVFVAIVVLVCCSHCCAFVAVAIEVPYKFLYAAIILTFHSTIVIASAAVAATFAGVPFAAVAASTTAAHAALTGATTAATGTATPCTLRRVDCDNVHDNNAAAAAAAGDDGIYILINMSVPFSQLAEYQYLKLGAYHTLDFEANRKLTLGKRWDTITLERTDTACDPAQNAMLAAVLMQESFCQ
ncbi:Hypothetical predicted protein [Octopus vulgaris]|uniref:Pelota N-terminal domain-containing protein n=1 Tax=Octopus vulgaris TaxID=6645 RepID=A0AA36FBQ1_OCTVU|nr:Hypothetical predicted protein [Octopus vulgaris]